MKLSIVIATWNRADRLAMTLDALRQLKLPSDILQATREIPDSASDQTTNIEVLVCDNNSTDHTKQIVESAIEQFPHEMPLRYIFQAKQGKSHALNKLIAETSGDWILFIDDDVKVDPGWLNGYIEGIAKYSDAACLGGQLKPWLDRPVQGRKAFLLENFPYPFGVLEFEQDTKMDPPDISAWGGNMALRRDAIAESGFDSQRGMIAGRRIAGEDVGMIQAVIENSKQDAWLLANATASHHVPDRDISVSRYCKWNRGLGEARAVGRKRAAPGRLGIRFWEWRKMAWHLGRALFAWRPWQNVTFYYRLADAVRYYGELREITNGPNKK
jgi:glucosyl-dolichyl phosphate glucuronosyltransferase